MRKQNSEYNNQGCSKFNFLSYTAMHLRRDLVNPKVSPTLSPNLLHSFSLQVFLFGSIF